MANPNPGGNVYHRHLPDDLHEAWNAAIRRVNGERANPPEDTDCEPLDEIEEVEEDHIWTKGDVEDIRSAIDEMCPFAWTEELTYWKTAIIDEIDEALSREYGGWGDEGECCEPACLPDCSNATDEPVEVYLGSYLVEACHANPDPYDWSEQEAAAEEAGGHAVSAMGDWSDLWLEYCALVDACEDLERELEILQEQLEALEAIRDDECAKPPPNNCASAQADVDAKQGEVDAKQEELDEKEVERDEKQSEADAKYAEADSYAAESVSIAASRLYCMHQLVDDAGSNPVADYECDQLGPECIGRDPLRCRVYYWHIQQKTHQYAKAGWEWHGNWGFQIGGGYTMSGQPYVLNIVYPCVPQYACASYGSNACEAHSWTWPSGCDSYYEHEYRLIIGYPSTTPEGEVCCDGGGDD